MTQNIVKIAITLVIILIMGLYLGVGVVSAQGEVLYTMGAILLVAIVAALGKKVWLLIPLVMLSSLSFRWIPGQWRTVDLAYLATFFGCALLFLTRKLDYQWRLKGIHIIAFLVVLSVVQTYVRNPVGLAVFGSSTVGGRAYFTFAIGLMIGLLLSIIKVPARELFAIRNFAMGGGIVSMIAQWLSYIPGFALPMTIAFGTGNLDFDGRGSTDSAGRNVAGADTAKVLSRLTIGFASPMKSLFFNRWTLIVALALFGGLISGWRSKLGDMILIFALGVYYWQGIWAVIVSFLIAASFLMTLAIVNVVTPLPAEVQRTLSFLPGTWEERFVRSGENSTDWRWDMWEEALTSDRWINNKVIGDGLGFSFKEFELQEALQRGRYNMPSFGKLTPQQVSFLINGDYHSGPVSFVRTVGYVGLVIFTVALLTVLVVAHRLMKRVKGTPYFGVVAFVCIPAIAHPILFWFVFGTFSGDVSQLFLNVGLISLLRNNIDFDNLDKDPRYEEAKEEEVVFA